MRISLRHTSAAGLVLLLVMLAAAPPASAQIGGRLMGAVDRLKPVGDSPVSGLSFIRVDTSNLEVRAALADARHDGSAARYANLEVSYATAPCANDEPGRTFPVSLEHVDGRGLEYRGLTEVGQGTLAARSLRIVGDWNGDGQPEELACGRVLRNRRGVSHVELEPRNGSGLSGLVGGRVRSGQVTDYLLIMDGLVNNEQLPEWTFEFARGRCGQPAGRTFTVGTSNLWDHTFELPLKELSRRERRTIRRARSVRIVGDWDGDGQNASAACGDGKLLGNVLA